MRVKVLGRYKSLYSSFQDIDLHVYAWTECGWEHIASFEANTLMYNVATVLRLATGRKNFHLIDTWGGKNGYTCGSEWIVKD